MEEPSIKYILLRDRVRHSVEKNMLSHGLPMKSTLVQVLRGEILEGVPEAEQPTDFTKVAVVGIERKSLRLECRTEDMARLSEEESNLLLAISSSEKRYETYIDRKRLAFGRKLGCVLVYRYTKEPNINELRHNSMYGYENNRYSPVYRYTRTAPKIVTRKCCFR